MEIWRTVIVNGEVYENYMVSNLGNIKSLNYNRTGKEKILKPGKRRDNYLYVNLYKDGKKVCLIHRLVAEAFLPKIEGKNHVDHIDSDRQNNVCTNLRWCTSKENSNFELCKKHKSEANGKKVLCIELNEIFGSVREAGRELGIDQSNISKCCNGKQKTSGNYHWRYVD